MKQSKGFSLIELLVVLAILAIIVAIAYPAFSKNIRRAACDAGKAGIMQAEAAMNQLYMKYGAYNNADAGSGTFKPVPQIPLDGSKADFDITFEATTSTYTITATATGTGRLQGKGILTINQKGEKTATGFPGDVNVWKDGCESL